MNIFITGATGNTGFELIKQLTSSPGENRIIAGVRSVERAMRSSRFPDSVELRRFDFEDPDTFSYSLKNIDIVFLLRPPHISNINKYFKPLIDAMEDLKVRKVVFLSVQGAEKSKIIPHRKIELLLLNGNFEYIFMRPSYFMQNLTTTLHNEIKNNRTVTLPAGSADFNWIDIEDVARLGAEFITKFENYKNNPYTITGSENLNFHEVIDKINGIAETNIKYYPVGPIKYFILKKKEKVESGMIIVMLILHFLKRFQGEPEIVNTIQSILKVEPTSIDNFIKKNAAKFI